MIELFFMHHSIWHYFKLQPKYHLVVHQGNHQVNIRLNVSISNNQLLSLNFYNEINKWISRLWTWAYFTTSTFDVLKSLSDACIHVNNILSSLLQMTIESLISSYVQVVFGKSFIKCLGYFNKGSFGWKPWATKKEKSYMKEWKEKHWRMI